MVTEPLRTLKERPSYLNQKIMAAHERLKQILTDPVHREKLRERIARFRKEDQSPTSYPQYRGAGKGRGRGREPVAEYYAFYYRRREEIRHITLLDIVREEIKKKGRIRVLDVGAGYGQALSELKEEFGDKVETHALVLKATEALQQAHKERRVDQIHEIEVSTWLPKQEYDVIVSFFGGIRYTPQREVALEKIINSLSENGVAYISFDLQDEDSEIRDILKRVRETHPNFTIDTERFYHAARITRIK